MQFAERYPHLLSTEGWLEDGAAQAAEDLLAYQRSRGLTGDIMEIGVYLGRFFIVLAKNLAPDEAILGLDIFESKAPTIPGSANTSRDACVLNLKKWLPELWGTGRLVILEEDSTDFALSDYANTQEGLYRFISIDGSHDTETVLSDLHLAHKLLIKGGIVALDDWNDYNQWPGVKEGWGQYDVEMTARKKEPRLRVVAEVPNKLILTNDPSWAGDYRMLLKDRALVVGGGP